MDKTRKLFSIKNVLIALGLILIDITIYLLLGIMLMDYDDFYDENKGEYWSLASMTFEQKANYIGLHLWNLLNLLFISYVIYKIIKTLRTQHRKNVCEG